MKQKVLAGIMITVLFLASVLDVSAATYGKAASGDYQSVGQRTYGTKLHIIYRAYSNGTYTNDHIYTGSKLLSPIWHTKGSGALTLTIQTSRSLSKTNTYSWTTNSAITTTYGLDLEFFKTSIASSVSCGCGASTTAGYSYTVSSGISKTVPSNAADGYYGMAPGYTYYNVKDYVINTSTGATDTIYFRMPYGDGVVYVIYSANNSAYTKY